ARVGRVPQGAFLNRMVMREPTRAPRDVRGHLQAVEAERGRGRQAGVRWGPRTLDLDIIRWGERRVHEPDLTIPHPELPHRDFWQREMAELDAAREPARG